MKINNTKNDGDNNVNVADAYESTKQALNLLDKMSAERHEEWNCLEMEKIRRDDEARLRANNRRRGIANDGPTYENGIQEWDD